MKNNTLITFLFLFLFSNFSVASITKKIINVKIPFSVDKIVFIYRDASFNEKFIILANTARKDTVISIAAELSSGQILRHSASILMEKKYVLVNQSFILMDCDTVKFGVDSNKRLTLIEGASFFIEDVINVFFEYPDSYQPPNNKFLDRDSGFLVSKSILNNNLVAIEEKYKNGLFSQKEYNILKNIAKTDFYYRSIYWAVKTNQLHIIDMEIANMQKDKAEMQSVVSYSLTQLFSTYIQYVRVKESLDENDTRGMVNSILRLGWNKNISFGYINFILSNIKADKVVLTKCYSDLKDYLDGELTLELEKLRKKILPVITNMNKVRLMAIDGKELTLKQLIDKNPNSYFLIDFWASWCIPCREEAPLFEDAKKKYLTKNIVFVSLSTDEDNKIKEWKKALEDDGLLKATNHYKLIAPKVNALFAAFKVPSLPRYILINAKGEIIDPEFPRPSDPEFISTLSTIQVSNKR